MPFLSLGRMLLEAGAVSDDGILHFNPWTDFNDGPLSENPFGCDPDPEQIYREPRARWSVRLDEIQAENIHEIWIGDYHLTGLAAAWANLSISDPYIDLDGELIVDRMHADIGDSSVAEDIIAEAGAALDGDALLFAGDRLITSSHDGRSACGTWGFLWTPMAATCASSMSTWRPCPGWACPAPATSTWTRR